MFQSPKTPNSNGILVHMQILMQGLCLLESLGCTLHVFVIMCYCHHPLNHQDGCSDFRFLGDPIAVRD